MSRRILLPAVLAGLLITSSAAPPAWWAGRGATSFAPADDHAALNLGQLKHFTFKAVEELNAAVPGGAGTELDTLVLTWIDGHPDPKDHDAIKVGQLKWIASKIHARLIHLKWEDSAPIWLAEAAGDDQLANLGQLKTVFNFDLSAPPGELPDWWQKFYFNGATGILPGADSDGDGLSNLIELRLGLNPDNTDTDGDGVADGLEDADGDGLANGQEDADGDGIQNAFEPILGFDPTKKDSDVDGIDDNLEDSDGDGLPDIDELLLGLDRNNPDSDGDGTSDGQEDSDGDGVSNRDEFDRGDDPASGPPVWRVAIREITHYHRNGSSLVSAEGMCNWPAANTALSTSSWTVVDQSALSNSFSTWNAYPDATVVASLPAIAEDQIGSVFSGPVGGCTTTPTGAIGVPDYNATLKHFQVTCDASAAIGEARTIRKHFLLIRRFKDLGGNALGTPDVQVISRAWDIPARSVGSAPVVRSAPVEINPAFTSPITTPAPSVPYTESLELMLVEVDSRDRGIVGSFAIPASGIDIEMNVGEKSYGSFSFATTPSGTAPLIYDDESDIGSEEENDNHDAWRIEAGTMPTKELQALEGVAPDPARPDANPKGFGTVAGDADSFDPRAITQEVVFWRKGGRVHFCTVSDDLGELELEITIGGIPTVASITHQLTAEEDFRRIIAAAEGLIAGDDSPEIQAWEDYPEPELPPEPLPAPPVMTPAEENVILAAAPAEVQEEIAALLADTPTLAFNDAEVFFHFVQATDFALMYADDNDPGTDEWTESKRINFFALIAAMDYAYVPGGQEPPVLGNGGANRLPGYRQVPPVRTEITLPAELRNRGLLAKALRYFIERTLKGNLAYGEGILFGLWDGVKGDVEGVADTVRLAVGGWDDAAIFIGRYLSDPYRAACELEEIFQAAKDLGWKGILNSVKAMANSALTDFTSTQEDRLKMVLGDECEDPFYLTCYYVGYTGGFVGEQVAVAFFTAGIAKAGVVSKVLRQGGSAVEELMKKASAKFPEVVTHTTITHPTAITSTTGEHIQKLSKGFYGEFACASRSADEVRSARRSASLCRTTAGCLAAGTLVAMADGTWRPVEQVHTGDQVVSQSTDGRRSLQTVETQIRNTAPFLQRISWDENGDGIADGTVSATSEHPFHVPGQGWVGADALRAEMPLTTDSDGPAIILEVTTVHGETTTYNLDVDGPDTFIVASRDGFGVLVHNKEGDTYPYNKYAEEGIQRGESYPARKINGVWVEETWLPKKSNPQHHFFWDGWLRANFAPQYTSYKDPFPCIELSCKDHSILEEAAKQWFKDNLGFQHSNGTPRYPAGPEWKKVKVKDIRAVAKYAAASIGIPENTIFQLSNAALAYLRKHYVVYGCNLKNLLHK